MVITTTLVPVGFFYPFQFLPKLTLAKEK